MTDQQHEHSDERLRELLRTWEPPEPPVSLDRRVAASWLQHCPTAPWWRRILTATVPVPVPLVALGLLVLAVAMIGLLRAPRTGAPAGAAASGAVSVNVALVSPGDTVGLRGFQPLPQMRLRLIRKGEGQ